MLNDRVLPFFDRHEYELYLAVEDIDHSRTKTKSPQTNGLRALPQDCAQRVLPRHTRALPSSLRSLRTSRTEASTS